MNELDFDNDCQFSGGGVLPSVHGYITTTGKNHGINTLVNIHLFFFVFFNLAVNKLITDKTKHFAEYYGLHKIYP